MVSQVGWIKFDGDEHHDFRYWIPEDRRRLDWITAQGYMPVYVPDSLDDDLAITRLIDGSTKGESNA